MIVELFDAQQWAALLAATEGWGGVVLIVVYSVLVAAVLPTPSELILLVPLLPDAPPTIRWTVIIVLGATAKMLGSVLAVAISRRVPSPLWAGPSGRLERLLTRRITPLVDRYGPAGLVVALSVPGVPDTVPIYAFALLGGSYRAYAAATFVGGMGRSLVVLAGVGGALTLV